MTDVHGGNIYTRPVRLDFSANINPLGMPENIRKAVINSSDLWERYPDPYCTELRNAIAEKYGTDPEKISVGNGAADLIYRIVHAFRPKKCVVAAPSFSEYEKALAEAGCRTEYYMLNEENDFTVRDDFADAADEKTDMIFLASPNNPTGRTVPYDILKKTAEKCLQNNCLLVVDECFMEFVSGGSECSALRILNSSMIVLKAFTKICAVPGIRLGFAVCGDPGKAALINRTGQFWSVSVPAQAAGIAALDNDKFIEETRKLISGERQFLEKKLSAAGIKTFRSDANFLLLKTAFPLYDSLLREGILIRSCGNYRGLTDEYYRIAVRTHDENRALIEFTERCING